MKIASMKPLSDFIIVKSVTEEEKTKSGLILGEQNFDDFLMQGEIVASIADGFPLGSKVFFHVLNTEAISQNEDPSAQFFLVPVNHIRGFYVE